MTWGIFRSTSACLHCCLVCCPGVTDGLCCNENSIVCRGTHHVRVRPEFCKVCLLEPALGVSNCTGRSGVGREPALDDGPFSILPEILVELGIVIVLDIEEDRVEPDVPACLRYERGPLRSGMPRDRPRPGLLP